MKHYFITSTDGIDAMQLLERDVPTPKPHQVLVKIHANALNYRDLLITQGGYLRSDKRPIIPVSDGAGEVVAMGTEVTNFAVGDRVAGNFFQAWNTGDLPDAAIDTALGGAIDGTLAEYVTLDADATVLLPDHLSYEEGATLPCAAVTAWHALQAAQLKAGDTVLLLGTGGVSLFGLQFAKAQGAEVIITSSSDEKLEKAKALGADHVINYQQHPEWSAQVMEITNGRGVNNVLEIGGAATLQQSIASAGLYGTISLIGLVTGFEMQMNLMLALRMQKIQGIYVGSTEMFRAMNRAIAQHNIKPVIDKVFTFDEAKAAYHHLAQAGHMGKVVIKQ